MCVTRLMTCDLEITQYVTKVNTVSAKKKKKNDIVIKLFKQMFGECSFSRHSIHDLANLSQFLYLHNNMLYSFYNNYFLLFVILFCHAVQPKSIIK